jgi:membrane protease YdiL (CAAX protease family)
MKGSSLTPEDTPIGPMPRGPVAAASHRRSRAGLVGFALVGGIAIFVGGTPYFEYTVANDSPVYNTVLVAVFGPLAWYMRRRDGLESYATCSHALFVAAMAMLIMVIGPFNWLVTAEDESVLQAVQDKLAQFLAVVPVILVLTWAAHRPWGTIYLQKGRPKRWLTFGLSWFVVSAIVVTVLALASGIDPGTLLSAAPLILVFAALNAVMEELWFRGVFLSPYSAGMGGAHAIVVTAVIFAAAHIGATYVSSVAAHLLLASVAVSIGVLAAWAMRWANALWGSVLFHMALDLVVVFGLLESV